METLGIGPIAPFHGGEPATPTSKNRGKSEMAKKRSGCGCVLMFVGGGFLLFVGLMVIGTIMSAANRTGGDPNRINSGFDQVGYFKSDKMRGMTYYVTNPNRQDIKAFCEKQLAKLPKGRILKIHFYDDRANTPNVSLKYSFPESSTPYLVADFADNPFNKSTDGCDPRSAPLIGPDWYL